jgi:hypothetical protein
MKKGMACVVSVTSRRAIARWSPGIISAKSLRLLAKPRPVMILLSPRRVRDRQSRLARCRVILTERFRSSRPGSAAERGTSVLGFRQLISLIKQCSSSPLSFRKARSTPRTLKAVGVQSKIGRGPGRLFIDLWLRMPGPRVRVVLFHWLARNIAAPASRTTSTFGPALSTPSCQRCSSGWPDRFHHPAYCKGCISKSG